MRIVNEQAIVSDRDAENLRPRERKPRRDASQAVHVAVNGVVEQPVLPGLEVIEHRVRSLLEETRQPLNRVARGHAVDLDGFAWLRGALRNAHVRRAYTQRSGQ